MTSSTLPIVMIIGSVIAIAILGAVATDTRSRWYQALAKPEWQPPNRLFAPIWGVLYIMLATSAIIVWTSAYGDLRSRLMLLYALNGGLNLAWSFLFFRARSPVIALIDILGLIVTITLIILRVWPVSPLAAMLMIPYLLWVSFAAVLNWTILRLNPIR